MRKFPYGNYLVTKENVDSSFWIAGVEGDSKRVYRVLAWIGEEVTLMPMVPLHARLPIRINGSFVTILKEEK